MKYNSRLLLIWSLFFIVGWCFGGKIGVGVAALMLLVIQLL